MDRLQSINFIKMHGLGNDFVVIDNSQCSLPFHPRKQQIIHMANRKLGIGCDQVLILDLCTNAQASFNYSVYNQDGSQAETCGNGARCIIKYILENRLITAEHVTIATKSRLISGHLTPNKLISVNMGTANTAPHTIPFHYPLHNTNNLYTIKLKHTTITFGVVSVENPHAIIKVNTAKELKDTITLEKIAKLLQQSTYFPESVNVNFYYIEPNQQLNLVTYERGCGFTSACGSGACATAYYIITQQQSTQQLNVSMDSGNLNIRLTPEGNIIMTGDATEVYRGTIIL